MATLIKIDRNGSKHFEETCTCTKCCGTGKVPFLYDKGRCWDCNGSGKIVRTWIERTPEYEAKLQERRLARKAKREAEQQDEIAQNRLKWLTNHGFTTEGLTYIFLGNTFDKKDELKALGAKFDSAIGWHIDHEVEGYHFITTNISNIAVTNFYGYEITANRTEWDERKKQAFKKLNPITKQSHHIGQAGQKLRIKATYCFTAEFDSNWGTTYIHKFEDERGNVFVWKASKPIEANKGEIVFLNGTVKEHSEYKGEKQTILTRCKQLF